MRLIISVCFLALLRSVCSLDGKFRFASYYGDHMVLQKGPERAVLWGYGPDGSEVTVSLSGPATNKAPAVNVNKGVWKVTLDPVEAGGPYKVTAALPNNQTLTLTDVLFGDVWLCGGQSNMAFTTSQVFNASAELAQASKFPHVRIFMASLEQSATELTDLAAVEVPWSVPTANLLGDGDFTHYSAVCWFFGRQLYQTLQYPVGLVTSCWGGTPVEAWSSTRALRRCGLDRAQDRSPMAYDTALLSSSWSNSVLWNAMIHPLLNMTLKGAIWYQGEANTGYNQRDYSCSFPSMIEDWRGAFHQGSGGQTALDLPFGFVQLSAYRKGSTSEAFPNVRWHQTADYGFVPNLHMKRTFMAVAMDLPDEKSPYGSIHPRDKQDVAFRLALGARAVAYGETGVSFQGPFPHQVLVTDLYINVTFDQTISVAKSQTIFEICCSMVAAPCGPRSIWVPAPMMHWGPTHVQVSTIYCAFQRHVSGLRYAWRDWPCSFKACPVYSSDRVLPAPPFILNGLPGQE